MIDPAEAAPDDVSFNLTWRPSANGGLTGELIARNIGTRTVRLSGKPALMPLGMDGTRLESHSISTAEMRSPGHVEISPGEAAAAAVGWGGWDGPPASGTVIIQWSGGTAEVAVDGPHQPSATGPATNLWSSWFNRKP